MGSAVCVDELALFVLSSWDQTLRWLSASPPRFATRVFRRKLIFSWEHLTLRVPRVQPTFSAMAVELNPASSQGSIRLMTSAVTSFCLGIGNLLPFWRLGRPMPPSLRRVAVTQRTQRFSRVYGSFRLVFTCQSFARTCHSPPCEWALFLRERIGQFRVESPRGSRSRASSSARVLRRCT